MSICLFSSLIILHAIKHENTLIVEFYLNKNAEV